jgi:hypothetical protein
MIRKILYDRDKMLKALIVTGFVKLLLIFATVATENAKFMGMGLLLFVIVVFWNLRLSFYYSTITPNDIIEHINKRITESWQNKRRFEGGIYFIVVPMLGIGFITILLILIAFFTIL